MPISNREETVRNVLSNSIDVIFENEPKFTHDEYVLSTDHANDGSYQYSTQTRLNQIRNFCGRIVTAAPFQKTVIVLIVICCLLMGVATFDFVKKDDELENLFETLDLTFLILFTLELLLQLVYHGLALFNNPWLTFDFLVIVASWALIRYPVQIIRAFRVIRALRLVNRIKELKDLVQAIINVIPRLFAIFLLLVLVFYVFAVMFTDLFGELYEEGITTEDYFSSLDRTAFTLFRVMLLDQWAEITQQCMQKYYWVGCFVFGAF